MIFFDKFLNIFVNIISTCLTDVNIVKNVGIDNF